MIVCDGSYKIRRRWLISDWCSLLGNNTFDQIVTIGDEVRPAFGEYPDTITYLGSPFDCNSYIPVYTPEVLSDANACSEVALSDYLLRDNQGFLIASGIYPTNTPITLPIGNYLLTSCAEDDCGNENCIEIVILVRDEIPSSGECPEQLTLLLNGTTGIEVLNAVDLYNGTDNCGEVTAEIRRNYWQNNDCVPSADQWSLWGENAFFYSCDFGIDISVEIRATDEYGNQNLCVTTVGVEENIAPSGYVPFLDNAMDFQTTTKGLQVYQNTPNPFHNTTQISFELAQQEKVHLSITDLTGQPILRIEIDGVAGYNTLKITPAMLNNSSGVLMYTLSTATQVVTNKMIASW